MTTSVGFSLSAVRVQVHPSVILSLLDGHNRYTASGNHFAIGTLLGTVTHEGRVVVDVVDCFVNDYACEEGETEVSIPYEFHTNMLKLKEHQNNKLRVVGWCITTENQQFITAVSDWARADPKSSRFTPVKQLMEPIIISIDANLVNHKTILEGTRALMRGPLEHLFHQVPLTFKIHDDDAPAIAATVKAADMPFVTLHDSEPNLLRSLRQLQSIITSCLNYTRSVIKGEVKGDSTVGRELLRALCMDSVASLTRRDQLCEEALQDTMAVAYLINLAKAQFNAAEELAHAATLVAQQQQANI